eukprot:2862767-Amphidinium_carterae.1
MQELDCTLVGSSRCAQKKLHSRCVDGFERDATSKTSDGHKSIRNYDLNRFYSSDTLLLG